MHASPRDASRPGLAREAIARTAAKAACLLTACASAALAAAAPDAAGATSIPSAATGGAHNVSYGSATVSGRVQPHGANTSYYFQYGSTRAYGAQTPVGDVPANVRAQKVVAAIGGLQPVTTYHYRLIAVNSRGARTGADRTFTTRKVPLSLQILVAPDPVTFGATATVEGTLSGTGNGNRAVVLQANPFPYTSGFADVGNAELTNPSGGFAFFVPDLLRATQFRVVTTTKSPVTSPVAVEQVAVRVSAHVARARRHHHVRSHHARIFGTVSPAVDGMQVGIMRVKHGHNVLVGGTVARPRNATSSRFSRVVRVHRGLYRVLVRVTNGAQTSNYSSPLLIR
jgi:hypothetical protein